MANNNIMKTTIINKIKDVEQQIKDRLGSDRQITTTQFFNNSSHSNQLIELKKRHVGLLHSLKKEKLRGNFGELRINLRWNTRDDLDLHVVDPSRNHIYYSVKEAISKGSKGQLDVDANADSNTTLNPQENIFWQQDPPSGKYRVFVKHYCVKQDKEDLLSYLYFLNMVSVKLFALKLILIIAERG
jgi:uncharacterized protein YfaP (DUF2135 family)